MLFAVPWLGKVIWGTTDAASRLARDPWAFPEGWTSFSAGAGKYLNRQPTLADVRSMWVEPAPLVKPLGR